MFAPMINPLSPATLKLYFRPREGTESAAAQCESAQWKLRRHGGDTPSNNLIEGVIEAALYAPNRQARAPLGAAVSGARPADSTKLRGCEAQLSDGL